MGKNIFKYTADFYIIYLIFINVLFVLHMSMAVLLSSRKSHIKIQTNQNIKVSHCLECGLQYRACRQHRLYIYNSSVRKQKVVSQTDSGERC